MNRILKEYCKVTYVICEIFNQILLSEENCKTSIARSIKNGINTQ